MSFRSSAIPIPQGVAAIRKGDAGTLAFAALGVVFGDIGTSPLYTLKVILALGGGGQVAAVPPRSAACRLSSGRSSSSPPSNT